MFIYLYIINSEMGLILITILNTININPRALSKPSEHLNFFQPGTIYYLLWFVQF